MKCHWLKVLIFSGFLSILSTSAVLFAPVAEASPFACLDLFRSPDLNGYVWDLLGTKGTPERPLIDDRLRQRIDLEFNKIAIRFKKEGLFLGTPMLELYRGEKNTRYLDENERVNLEVSIQNGLVLDIHGQPIDTTNASSAPRFGSVALYVMDRQGKIYISKFHTHKFPQEHPIGFYHSSILAGADVASAGMITIRNGVIKWINNSSGHYHPSNEIFTQVLWLLKARGVPIEGIAIQFDLGGTAQPTLDPLR